MAIEKLNASEVAFLCNQISIILDSGVSLQEGLEILMEDTHNKSAKRILENIVEGISDKKPLYKVLKESGVFPNYLINMVRIGEASGKLDEIFSLLANYYTTEDEIKKSLRNAIFRPIVLLIMMFFVVAVLVIKIIPSFTSIFHSLNIDINSNFENTMEFALNMGLIVLISIAVIVGVLLLSMLLINTNKGKEFFKVIIDSSIFTKNLSQKIALSRFSMAMSLMIKSGIDTTEALEYVRELISSRKIKKKINKCYDDILDNKGFIESIVNSKMYTSMQNQMLKVSYKTGAFENAWEKISDTYSREVDELLDDVLQSIEPIMVAIMTIVIGAILMSVMIPLMGIMTSIG